VSSTEEKSENYFNFNKIWAISNARYSEIGPDGESDVNPTGPIKEYRLSDIGRYLLNPNTIEVNKKLIGCEAHLKPGGLKKISSALRLKKISSALRRLLPGFVKRRGNGHWGAPEVMVSRFKLRIPPLKDSGLQKHIARICDQLRVHDSLGRRLAQLDPRRVFQMVGICEDVGGNYSYLKLQGSIEEKIKYIIVSASNLSYSASSIS